MAKAAEKLTILNNAAQGLLQRLGHTKKILSSPTLRPVFLGHSQFAKASAALLKKFPEFEANVEKVVLWPNTYYSDLHRLRVLNFLLEKPRDFSKR